MTQLGYKEEILRFLRTVDGQLMDICYALHERLKTFGDANVLALQFFLTEFERVDSDKSQKVELVYFVSESEEYEERIRSQVDQYVDELIKNKVSEQAFYEEIWKHSQDKQFYANDKESAYVIYSLLTSPRCPYFELQQGIQMENEEYSRLLSKLTTETQKVRFILASQFNQKTEYSSLLLDLLDSIEDKSERIVLLTTILYYSFLQSMNFPAE
ncbi:MAG: hypothetical protein ACOYKD_03100 [Anaerolineaceae bacterium]|jgi:hypothetical protein